MRRGFPGNDPEGHLRTIPACAALGLRQETGDRVATVIDGRVAATRDGDGRIARGAALVLADQATAGGVFASLDAPRPMMTLDLRLDWCAPLPTDDLACVIDDVTRDGDLALVRARLIGRDGAIGAATARYLIGAMPGGGQLGEDAVVDRFEAASHADFASWLDAQRAGDALVLAPRADHIGARSLPALHGGVVAALLDQAANGLAGDMRAIDIEVRYVAPARADRPLIARATPTRIGRRAATIDVVAVQDDATRPVALARALFMADAPGAVSVLAPRG